MNNKIYLIIIDFVEFCIRGIGIFFLFSFDNHSNGLNQFLLRKYTILWSLIMAISLLKSCIVNGNFQLYILKQRFKLIKEKGSTTPFCQLTLVNHVSAKRVPHCSFTFFDMRRDKLFEILSSIIWDRVTICRYTYW